ncbi:MAG: ATP-binding protein, partial [Defluviitaleaceae bacterium]|nr:ATP-binding protein [Defluviitaleaceae bacterium]
IAYQAYLTRKQKYSTLQSQHQHTPQDSAQRLARLNETFKHLKPEDFMCTYESNPSPCARSVSESEISAVLKEHLLKPSEKDQRVNCSACGYKTCRQMAEAIALGINHRDSCVYYVKNILANRIEEKTAAEAGLRTIIDSMPLVSNVLDKDFKIVECNGEALRMFEMKDALEYRKRFPEINPPLQPDGTPSAEKAALYSKQALETGHVRFEWMHQSLTGEPIPCDITLMRFDWHGENHLLTFIMDKREFYKSQENIRTMEQRLKAMLDASPILCAIYDEDYKVIESNQAAATLFGLADRSIYAERFLDLCPEYQPDGMLTRDKVPYVLGKAFELGRLSFEWMHQTFTEKTPIPCEVYLERVSIGDKNVIVAFARDLREQYKLKEMQATEQGKVYALLDSSPMVCMIVERDCSLLSVNKKAEALFEIPDREIFVNNIEKFFPEFQPDGMNSIEKNMAVLNEAYEKGFSRYEWMYQTYSGEPIPCEEILQRVNFGGRELVMCYIRDLREEKEMLAQLEAAIDREQLANKAKTRFLARMSHEIRTPMNSVLGIAELQLQKDTHPQETDEAFSRIYSSSNMLLSIINDILDLSKVEAGKMEIVPMPYESASMIVDTVQLNLMYIGSKRIDFKLHVDENIPAFLVGDELRIKQILNNLLSNAFKYTFEGTVGLSFTMEPRDETDDIIIVLKVSDTGQGMTNEQVESLHGEFVRFNLENNRAIEGTGLGLTIVYQLINMMYGDISVESQPGKGSTFTVRLPQKAHGKGIIGIEAATSMQNLEDTQKSLKRLSKQDREPMPYGRVLVVDDVESNLYVAKGFLIPYKLAVETVESGILAIEKVKSGEVYDIIFMDHMMPDMDGVEATKILRELGYDQPIVALTANAFSDMAEMFMNNGFSGYASKPIDINQIDRYLLRFIRDKQPPEVVEKARAAKLELTKEDSIGLSEMLIQSFLRDARKATAILGAIDMRQEIPKDIMNAYIVQSHAMKSALHNIGRKDLSNMANSMEQVGRRDDMDTITYVTPQFLRYLEEIVNELEPGESSGTHGKDGAEDTAYLQSQLQVVWEACELFDIDSAKGALKELAQINFSKQTKSLLNEIYDLLLSGDFDEASSLAKQATGVPE